MAKAIDMLGREISVGDFVVYTNNIYEVKDIGESVNYVRIMLANPSPSTRPQNKYSKQMYLIPKEDYLLFLLKK